MNARTWLVIGALIAGSAVASGALGAHWFEDQAVRLYGENEALRLRRIDNWDVAVEYQMYHGLAVMIIGCAVLFHSPSRWWDAAGALLVLGVVLFSGSLYVIALSGATSIKEELAYGVPLIIATPAGGVLFLAGWVLFLAAAFQLPK